MCLFKTSLINCPFELTNFLKAPYRYQESWRAWLLVGRIRLSKTKIIMYYKAVLLKIVFWVFWAFNLQKFPPYSASSLRVSMILVAGLSDSSFKDKNYDVSQSHCTPNWFVALLSCQIVSILRITKHDSGGWPKFFESGSIKGTSKW